MRKSFAGIAATLLVSISILPVPAAAQQPQAMCRETLEAWVRDKSLNARWNKDRTAVIMVRGGVEYICTCPSQNRPPVCRPSARASSGGAATTASPASTNRPAAAPARPAIPSPSSGFDREKKALLRELEASRLIEAGPGADNAVRLGNVDGKPVTVQPEIAAAVRDMAAQPAASVSGIQRDIAASEAENGRLAAAVARSLKGSPVPPLAGRFDNLKVGDVLLLRQPDDMASIDFYKSGWIIIVDKALSLSFRARASHTFMFVREVKGVKLFLDNMPGQGTRIKTEAQIMADYGSLDMDVARPLSAFDSDLLWTAARQYGIRSIKEFAARADQPIDKTDYGIYGDGDKVCSETSRWALIKAGMFIPETRSNIKKFAGDVDFGPSDFYKNSKYFLITPLEKLSHEPK